MKKAGPFGGERTRVVGKPPNGEMKMATIIRFEDLDAWRLARELTGDVYRITRNTEFSRDFALVNQMRKASVSAMSNIAEGFERDGNKEFAIFSRSQKDRPAKCGRNFTLLSISIT